MPWHTILSFFIFLSIDVVVGRVAVADPHSFHPDPDLAFKAEYQSGSGSRAFMTKTAIYLSLGIHKVCASYRRSLQLSKEAIQHFKT
jgi:hypothetical protein